MKIGKLDKRIEVQTRSAATAGAHGGKNYTWATTDTIWANIQDQIPSRAEAVVAGAKEVSINRTRIRIRWRDDVDSTARFKLLLPVERIFQIVGGPAEIGGRKAYLEYICEEVRP